MKEKTVIAGILGILLIGILSAALIPHFGQIVGQITVTSVTPGGIDDCKNDGWMNFTKLDGSEFKNQGDCISYIATNMCKDDGWKNLTREDGSNFENQGQCISYFSKEKEDSPEDEENNESQNSSLKINNSEEINNESNSTLEINISESTNETIEENIEGEIPNEEIINPNQEEESV